MEEWMMDVCIDRNRFYVQSIERVHHDDRELFQTIRVVAEGEWNLWWDWEENEEFTFDNSSNRAGSGDLGWTFDCWLERCAG